MNRRLVFAAIPWVVSALIGSATHAQGQSSTLEGRITDEQAGALAGSTVTVESPLLATSRVAITGATGEYRLPDLPPGVYTVTIAIPGFRSQRHEGVAMRAGSVRVLSATLELAPLSQRVDVVGVAPTLSGGVPRNRLPAAVAVIDADDLALSGAVSIASLLNERLGAVSLSDTSGNPFQPTIRFRGFTASPLLGLPQGVAVFQNGARVNEPFGDTVQFDLIPQFAIEHIQVSAGTEPTYGLNALGGAMALRLKSGFDVDGFRGEFSGGSFERIIGTAEVGASAGPWAVYLGGTRFDETGWRTASDSGVTQAVGDVAYRASRVNAGVSFTYADTKLNGNGPAPVELLEADRAAVFTYPDTTENRLGFGQGRFELSLAPTLSLQANGYYRDLDRSTLNGDEAEFGVCERDARPPGAPGDTLCHVAGDDDDDGPGGAAPLVDVLTGAFITTRDAAGDGALHRSFTRAKSYGASVQLASTAPMLGRDNVLVIGGGVDLADVAFASNSELGTLTFDRSVSGSGRLAGIHLEAPDDEFNTAIDTANRAFGVYFSDTFSLTPRLHLSLAGRYNESRLDISDRLGTSLDGRHVFSRFNPSAGLVYETSPNLSLFTRYSESNRAPTAAELSCADPTEPCRVPNAFVSDPPLEQAIARSVEAGARGTLDVAGLTDVGWSLTGYGTRIRDDILFVASPFIGSGFFQNGGDTQRVGFDLEVTGSAGRVGWYASYGLVEATFASALSLPGNEEVNDAVTDEGTIEVRPGDRLPGIPRHNVKGGLRYELSSVWNVAFETVVASSQVFRGDEGNDQEPLAGYGIVNVRSSYQVTEAFDLFVLVDNLFDRRYATFGVLAQVELDLVEAPGADDPRFVAPGSPRSAFAGFRLRF